LLTLLTLQDAAEALQDAVCMLPAATGGIGEGGSGQNMGVMPRVFCL
jgi:hypothetical protein